MDDSRNTDGRDLSNSIPNADREQMLLDDLRAEVSRLADAVERNNTLLERALEEEGEVIGDP